MPTIYGKNRDGTLSTTPNSLSWANARGFTGTATNTTTSSTSDNAAVAVYRFSGRGADSFRIHRSFHYFDCTSITVTPVDATLKIYITSDIGDSNIRVIKSTAFGLTANGSSPSDLAATDFDNVDFSTSYSDEVTVSGTGQLSITLTSTALSDMVSRDYLGLALVNSDYDYANTSPTTFTSQAGIRYANYVGSSSDPQIEYTAGSTGYANTVLGVAASSYSKIIDVDKADISKVIGVE